MNGLVTLEKLAEDLGLRPKQLEGGHMLELFHV